MHKMPAFVWWLAPEPETISVQHSNNYIGCNTYKLCLLMHKIYTYFAVFFKLFT